MPREQVIGTTMYDHLAKDEADTYAAEERKAAEKKAPVSREFYAGWPDGVKRNAIVIRFPVFDEAGNIVARGVSGRDVSELRRTEAIASEAQERLVNALNAFPEAVVMYDANDRLIFQNTNYRIFFAEYFDRDPIGMSFEEILRVSADRGYVPEAEGRLEEWVRERMEQHRKKESPIRFRRLRDTEIWLDQYDIETPDGGSMVFYMNATEQQHKDDLLRQAQKMEAVGQLTGGVAHDFNNLMAVMLGNAEILESRIGDDDNARRAANAIIRAVNRGTSLTHRLLAFSRRQPLSPIVANANDLIAGIADMLRRTLGETIDLRVEDALDIWPTMIDPHQFEDALLNLAINARDAMPNGGQLIIETANVVLDETYATQQQEVTPGDYVEVAVSDTGTGMHPETLDKVFEPFFTTKDVGKGSGLGLSMVYGFVKQSKGHVTIYSEIGHGTTIKLYLPRSTENVVQEDVNVETLKHEPGSERILVVEDDPNVREIPVSILRDQGYEVVEASDGVTAIKLLKGGQHFDLLFSDVVLPGGLNGVEIAEEAKRIQPSIKVLYTTGYAENTFAQGGRLDPTATLVNKPYRRAELLEKVRAILDNGDAV